VIYSVEADEETIEAEYGLVGQVVNSDEAEVQSRLPASKSLGKEPPNLGRDPRQKLPLAKRKPGPHGSGSREVHNLSSYNKIIASPAL
jgi:hypothetical protein